MADICTYIRTYIRTYIHTYIRKAGLLVIIKNGSNAAGAAGILGLKMDPMPAAAALIYN